MSDILALLLAPSVSWRGERGVRALVQYMIGVTPIGDAEFARAREVCRTALLDAYPELGAVVYDDPPSAEFRELWVRRRCSEFGTYLLVPRMHSELTDAIKEEGLDEEGLDEEQDMRPAASAPPRATDHTAL